MKPHYNLYYIFLEDKFRNVMSRERMLEIQRILEDFFRAIRPPIDGHDRLNEKN